MSHDTNRTILAVAVLTVVAVAAVGVTAAGLGVVGADDPTDTEDPLQTDTADDAQSPDRTIAVDATGTATAAPDEAVVRVAVTAEGEESTEIRDRLATTSADLETALEELGVEYRTTGYEIEQPRAPRDAEVPDLVGTHAYEVTLDEPDRVGTVVDVAADVGAEIRGIDLTLSEAAREQLRDKAIENAMSDARGQAETIAETGTLELGQPVSVDATQGRFSPVRLSAEVALETDDAAPTEIATGDVSVTYDVEVVYGATGGE